MSQQYSLIANIVARTDSFMNAINDVSRRTDELAKNFASKTKVIGEGFTDVGKSLTTKLSLPLVAVGTASAKMAMDFEAQMDRVGAIAGATGKEMDALTQSAMKLGADTSKSAGEVAVAMEDMAAMGFNAVEIMGAMPGVISASEASGESLALASQTVASALNIWGLEASEASRVADVLAMAANNSAAGIGDMQMAFKYAGAPAAALGIEMEDVAAAIGIMTDAGLDGSGAGTALRASLLALNNPAKAQQKMMEKLGISMRDENNEAISLAAMVGVLAEQTEHMSEADRVATLAKLVGTEAVSGFLSLIAAGPDKINEMSGALRDSAGASAETAAIMKDNLKGSLEELGGTIETASITIGNMLIPYIRKAADTVQMLVEKFINFSPEIQKTILVIGGIIAAIGPILMIFGTIFTSISGIVTGFTAVSGAIAGTGGALVGLATPIGWVIGVIAALVAAGILLYKNWDTIKAKAIEVFGNFQPLFNTLKGVFQTFMTSLQPLWESLKTLFQSLMPILQMVGAVVGGVLVTAFGLAISIFAATASAIVPLVNAVVNFVDVIANVVNAVIALVTGDLSGAMEYWKQATESSLEVIKNLWTGVINFFATFVKTIVDFFHGLYTTLVGNSIIPDMVNEIVAWFKNMFKWVVDLVKNIVTDVVKWFTDLANNITLIFTAILTFYKVVWTDILNFFKMILTEIFNTGKAIFTSLSNTISTIVNGIKTTITSVLTAIKTTVNTIFTAIKTTSVNIWNSIKSTISSVVSSISSYIATTFNTVLSNVQRIFNNVKTAITNPIETARDRVKSVVDSITGFFSNMKLKIPEISLPKLPKFSMTGDFSLSPPSVPKIGVKWNALGGVFTKPTVLNTRAGLQGFGEVAGESEAILPLNSNTFAGIGKGIAQHMNYGGQQTVTENYNITFNVEKMTGNEADVNKFTKAINDNLKRTKGVRR